MSAKRKKKWFANAISAVLGLACAVVLGALFYGAMSYQLSGVETRGAQQEMAGEPAMLALSGAELISEQTTQETYGGADCTVHLRTYRLQDGAQAEAITAQPAAYLERISQEGYVPQLLTGFTIAGLDAVYALRGEEGLLAAQAGGTVYMIRMKADEQAAYALGAGALFE